jgi:hypothetical protein
MIRLRIGLVVVAGLCALSTNAFADDDAAYQVHYNKARELVRAEDLRDAIKEFEAAYAAFPKPEPLFNIGVLYRRLATTGDTVEDAERSIDNLRVYLERYRALHGNYPPDESTVARYISELRQRFDIKDTEPTPATPPAAAPTTQDSASTQVTPAPVRVVPPSTPQDATPPPAVPSPVTTPPAPPAGAPTPIFSSSTITEARESADTRAVARRSKTRLILGCTLLGAGGVIAATGAVLLGVGSRDASGNDFATVDAFNSHVSAFQDTGIALLAVGGAAVVGGIITFGLPARTGKRPSASIQPNVKGVLAGGRF